MEKRSRLNRAWAADAGNPLRAGDIDRERVAKWLLSAHAEGRLDLAEYDERVQQAWAAKTYGQLGRLTADLPEPRTEAPPTLAPPTPRLINGFAIASVVLGIVWLLWIGSFLALAFGYIARGQIKKRNDRGAHLATAGITLGWVGVGTLAILMSLIVLAIAL
ncbi:MAG TPA: DUF1707 and DUF4190 domain-containing protein [Pseudonocardiaceae bacterium]|nr:DUF1707 and DUF4190 domain-containing protein [Pseudonocardiaceae bacterium]